MERLTKEEKRREAILSGNLTKVILSIALPLVIYDLCNFLYGIFDMMVVSNSQIGNVSSIVILEQIREMVSTFGVSFGLGGSILVARKLGAKQDEEAKISANTVFFMTLAIAVATVVLLVPFSKAFLRLFTVQEVIDESLGYFNVQICSVALITMNSVFIGLEKAKGNSSRLLGLNLMVIIIKVSLTCLFIYGPFENVTVTWVAVATLIAQAFLFVVGLRILFSSKNIIAIEWSYIRLKWKYVKELVVISLPIFIGRFLFTYGKVSINQLATTGYSAMAVGCLGLSNSINGIVSSMIGSFQDTASTIISQNYGSGNGQRVKATFVKILQINLIVAALGVVGLTLANGPIVGFFANSLEEQTMLTNIAKYERISLFFLAIENGSMALLYGLGKTKITMTVSMLKVFLFRLPVLYLFIKLGVGYIACGYVMFISVLLAAILALVAACIVVRKTYAKQGQ